MAKVARAKSASKDPSTPEVARLCRVLRLAAERARGTNRLLADDLLTVAVTAERRLELRRARAARAGAALPAATFDEQGYPVELGVSGASASASTAAAVGALADLIKREASARSDDDQLAHLRWELLAVASSFFGPERGNVERHRALLAAGLLANDNGAAGEEAA